MSRKAVVQRNNPFKSNKTPTASSAWKIFCFPSVMDTVYVEHGEQHFWKASTKWRKKHKEKKERSWGPVGGQSARLKYSSFTGGNGGTIHRCDQ